MEIKIVYASAEWFESFHRTLDKVAREQIYLEMIEAKPLAETIGFQEKLIAHNWPGYYAVAEGEVVGWADITRALNPRLDHRGFLGMGILHGYRGRGIGSALLAKALEHAKEIGLEKVELTVYTTNEPAIQLYKKLGFTEIGVIKHYRKLGERYFDCLEMEKFL